ncbi:MAG TPA: PLD nuclease N-terminal domain-containing protein [Candidatus Microbacterium pullistercoris]|nr:PLD nuclease N-terminal domain-containing protein [Candidatus Microbacterium pullistercoris]
MPFLIGLVNLAFFVVSLIDIIRLDEARVRYLPKMAWIIVVILLPFIGGILWWTIGREYAPRPAKPAPRPGRVAPTRPPVDTRTTEQQLADLEREEYEAKLREEIARRQRERGTD